MLNVDGSGPNSNAGAGIAAYHAQQAQGGGVQSVQAPAQPTAQVSTLPMMVQFTSTGTLNGGPQTFRWSSDGGTTWSTGTTSGRTLSANGVTVTMLPP